jgi:hypothetical protein
METFQSVRCTIQIVFQLLSPTLELVCQKWIINLPSLKHLGPATAMATRKLLRLTL